MGSVNSECVYTDLISSFKKVGPKNKIHPNFVQKNDQ